MKICENCKFEDVGTFDEPCRSCIIDTNSNWQPVIVTHNDNYGEM